MVKLLLAFQKNEKEKPSVLSCHSSRQSNIEGELKHIFTFHLVEVKGRSINFNIRVCSLVSHTRKHPTS
jgi:hypothetical protein